MSLLGWIGSVWGVMGVVALLARAVVGLTPIALEPALDGSMTALHWTLYVAWIAANAYMEGYRGFQKSFSPRVVARAHHLGKHPTPLRVALAPVFCMAMFHAKKKNIIVAWCLFFGIVLLVILVRMLPQPWRGIVDAGVVVGLVWGTLSILVLYARCLMGIVPADDSLPNG